MSCYYRMEERVRLLGKEPPEVWENILAVIPHEELSVAPLPRTGSAPAARKAADTAACLRYRKTAQRLPAAYRNVSICAPPFQKTKRTAQPSAIYSGYKITSA